MLNMYTTYGKALALIRDDGNGCAETGARETEEVDVVEIMQQIREKIRLRREANSLSYTDHDRKEVGTLDEEVLRDSLEQADVWHDKIFVGDLQRPSESLPTRLLGRLRKPLHELVRFYLDRMSEKQVIFNANVLKALKVMAYRFESERATARELERLRKEVDELRKQLKTLGRTADRADASAAPLSAGDAE